MDLNTSANTSQESVGADDDVAPFVAQPPVEDMEPDMINLQSVAKFTEPGLKQIHITHLKWDRRLQWGQIRPLNDDQVLQYFKDIKRQEPSSCIKVLVRSIGTGV